MQTVELLTGLVGSRGYRGPGDLIDLPDDEAERFIARGMAKPIDRPIETAALKTIPSGGKYDGRIQDGRGATRGNRAHR